MIHRKKQWLTIQELQKLYEGNNLPAAPVRQITASQVKIK